MRNSHIINALMPRLNEITHLTGEGRYSWVHFTNSKSEIYGYPLIWFESRLPLNLIRLHKAVSVRRELITGYQRPAKTDMHVSFCGQSARVAVRRVYEVARQLQLQQR